MAVSDNKQTVTVGNGNSLNSLQLPGKPEDTRIVVAMSGGVDSSVVAGMLKAEGYDVIGMTMQLYDHGEAIHRKGACCSGQDIHDAKRVAETLGIPHYVLNYEDKFQKSVIDPFAKSYMDGETPIPCVACNQTVKFVDLLATAKELGAAALATGHYVASRLDGNRRALFRPVDAERDQSYFLFTTTQEQLDFLRFPLGDRPKSETREMARQMGLSVAEKSDSQDICFVPEGRYSDVITKLKPEAMESGDIVHIDGRVLGIHKGIINYTIGQRRGIGIAVGEPLYVIHLDAAHARVIVGPKEALATHKLFLRDVNWIGRDTLEEALSVNLEIYARVRSTRPPEPAILSLENGKICVTLTKGEGGIAPGQACVFYANDSQTSRILGGGWIEHCEREAMAEQALANISGGHVVHGTV
jgi:tRNA-specific 2-thiouridylase